MSSVDTLKSKDSENVVLERMENIAPSKDRPDCDSSITESSEHVETCVVECIDYDAMCDMNDDDSNIGSMVSVRSEETSVNDTAELIVPDVTNEEITAQIKDEPKPNQSDSWPTLEILPGGVIKLADKLDDDYNNFYKDDEEVESGDMMYACAKCSQKFMYLFCLVRHVKWHENEEKKAKAKLRYLGPKHVSKNLTEDLEEQLLSVKKARNEFTRNYKKRKVVILARIASALGNLDTADSLLK